MRAWLVAFACVLGISLGRAQVPSSIPNFDHNLHARDIAVSGANPIECAACHAQKNGVLIGRPDHRACFGACHGAPPAKARPGKTFPVPEEQKHVCVSCHTEAALAAPLAKTVPVPYPPYLPTDFALALPHRRHDAVACGACHFLANPAKPPHKRCLGCHDGSGAAGKGPAMTACSGCHTPGSGSPLPPTMSAPIDTVTSEFSHPKHAARGGAGAQCATCHQAVRETDDSILPRPKQASCAIAGCHDGKGAFAATIACTKCHTAAPKGRFDVERPPDRYEHATTHRDVKLPCATCHPLGPTGEVLVAGHAACTGCHEERFGERRHPKDPEDPSAKKQICGACHNATEPWRKLTADRPPRERTEFGATLQHDKHPGACTSCHALATGSLQLRTKRGHAACTGAACHAVKGGAAPQLTACERCHELGLAERRIAVRTTLQWSVRQKFDHAPHRAGRDGAAIACTTCHDDLHGDVLAQLAAPKKASCQPCHDGATAFKLTGTTCTRCHAGAPRPTIRPL